MSLIDAPVVRCVRGATHLNHVPAKPRRALLVAILFCTTIMFVEGICGLIANSLAILSDAVHMLADVFALSISLFALHALSWGATATHTYGWRRAEVVGALCSILTTLALVLWILLGAAGRTVELIQCARDTGRMHCEEIDAKLMFSVGVFGLLMNVVLAVVLHAGGGHGHSHGALSSIHTHEHAHAHQQDRCHSHAEEHVEHGAEVTVEACGSDDSSLHFHCADHTELLVHPCQPSFDHAHQRKRTQSESQGNMNLRAAMLHVFGDCLQALGVVLAAGFIWLGNVSTGGNASSAHSYFNLADPLLSVLFGVITVYTTLNLLKEVVAILLEQVPLSVDYGSISDALTKIENVEAIDDLHITSLGPGFVVLSTHLRVHGCTALADVKRIVDEASWRCNHLGIDHATVQVNLSPVDE